MKLFIFRKVESQAFEILTMEFRGAFQLSKHLGTVSYLNIKVTDIIRNPK